MAAKDDLQHSDTIILNTSRLSEGFHKKCVHTKASSANTYSHSLINIRIAFHELIASQSLCESELP